MLPLTPLAARGWRGASTRSLNGECTTPIGERARGAASGMGDAERSPRSKKRRLAAASSSPRPSKLMWDGQGRSCDRAGSTGEPNMAKNKHGDPQRSALAAQHALH